MCLSSSVAILHRLESPNFQDVRLELLLSSQEGPLLVRGERILPRSVVALHLRSPPTIALEYKICVTKGKRVAVVP